MGRQSSHLVRGITERNGDFTIARVIVTQMFTKKVKVEVEPGVFKTTLVPSSFTFVGTGATKREEFDKDDSTIGEGIALSRALRQVASEISHATYERVHQRCVQEVPMSSELSRASEDVLELIAQDVKAAQKIRKDRVAKAAVARKKGIADYEAKIADMAVSKSISKEEARAAIKAEKKDLKQASGATIVRAQKA
jgi:hypothetical protein